MLVVPKEKLMNFPRISFYYSTNNSTFAAIKVKGYKYQEI